MKQICLSEAALKNNANIWNRKQANCKLWSLIEEAKGSKLTSLQSSATVGETTLVCCRLVYSKWSFGQTHKHTHTCFSHVWRQCIEWLWVWKIVGEVFASPGSLFYFAMCWLFVWRGVLCFRLLREVAEFEARAPHSAEFSATMSPKFSFIYFLLNATAFR